MVHDHKAVLKAEKRRKTLDTVADVFGGALCVGVFLLALYCVLRVLAALWFLGMGWLSIVIVGLATAALIWLLLSKKTNDTLRNADKHD